MISSYWSSPGPARDPKSRAPNAATRPNNVSFETSAVATTAPRGVNQEDIGTGRHENQVYINAGTVAQGSSICAAYFSGGREKRRTVTCPRRRRESAPGPDLTKTDKMQGRASHERPPRRVTRAPTHVCHPNTRRGGEREERGSPNSPPTTRYTLTYPKTLAKVRPR